ncbi:MAG: phosphoglucosamine mutase [Patescibacteria group bacterium]|nr:phosphoglucosamine mutase [Patescibacteria group bacterium]
MKLFGTDGIRDLVGGEKMNAEIAAAFGKAIVFFCKKRNLPLRIIIGRDTRESGPELQEAVVAGIVSASGEALLAGVIPTPAVSYLAREEKAGAGIVISASHNPYRDNGLKPFKNDGTKFSDEEEKEIEKYILESAPSEKESDNPGKKIFLPDAKEKYINFILGKLPVELSKARPSNQGSTFPLSDKSSNSSRLNLSGIPQGQTLKNSSKLNFRLILDCANGATFEVAPAVFKKVAKNTDSLFASPNGKNINDNCGSQYTQNLKKEVKERSADLGLAFDGDGDRVIAVDEKGRELTGDHMIYIIAKMLKAKEQLKNDLVITTVMSNLGFVKALEDLGIKHIATGVGDRQVLFEMQKSGSVLGGEEAGHIIYSDFHPAGDGIVGGIMLLAAMDYFKKPLSELAGEIALFPKLLVNVEVRSKPELGTIPEIQDIIREAEKKLESEGRIVVRYSGTENLCRVMVEGRDEGEIKEYAEKIAGAVRKKLS